MVDGQGQVRASITIEPDGAAVFRMRDRKAAIRVKVGASDAGSALLLLDESTNPGVHALAKGGKGSLTVNVGRSATQAASP